jgi:hypothetical protein
MYDVRSRYLSNFSSLGCHDSKTEALVAIINSALGQIVVVQDIYAYWLFDLRYRANPREDTFVLYRYGDIGLHIVGSFSSPEPLIQALLLSEQVDIVEYGWGDNVLLADYEVVSL